MVLDVLEEDLLILHVISHAHVSHVLSAEESEVVESLWHVHD